MKFENREYYIDKDGFKIHAKLDLPEHAQGKLPIVIVVHGLTGHMEETHIIAAAETALRAGYAALRVEMYGHGKTDGRFCNHDLYEWISELMYVIDHVRGFDFVSDIYLAGHSQGGLTVMLTAAMKARDIRGILPLSPAVVILDACRTGEIFGLKYDPADVPDELHIWEDKYITSNYVYAARTLDIDAAIKGFDGPVLIVHGDEDEAVPVSYGIDAASKYRNASLVLIEGDDHCYHRHLDLVEKAVYDFLIREKQRETS